MSWTWSYEKTDGSTVGESQSFDNRGDAESWIGEGFHDLLEQGVDQVRLMEDGNEVFGPMSIHPDH